MNAAKNVKIGIIGGTGLNDPKIFHEATYKDIVTPFGNPSDRLEEGIIEGVPCVLLPRHGKNHNINPSNINYRANIWALKKVGCTHILAATACGSLQETFQKGDFVVLDQFFDRTAQRQQSFYDGSCSEYPGIFHVPMGDPFNEKTRQVIIKAAKENGVPVHESGTVVTIEGPRFSSRFESQQFQKMGCSVINMTTVPEVVLAKEIGLCYAAIGMVTDYDSWHASADSVDAKGVVDVVSKNADRVKKLIVEAVKLIGKTDWKDIFEELENEMLSAKL